MTQPLSVALVGYAFMGRAHSNAWNQVSRYFDLPYAIEKKVIIGRNAEKLQEAADTWGWEHTCADLSTALATYPIDVVDIATPNDSHYPLAMAAIAAGKHVICEKPLALTAEECETMTAAASQAGVHVGVWHNYRRCPAASLARQLIEQGEIGDIRHVRGIYLQDWLADPASPATWRMRKEFCGSGAHGDLNAHLIDMTRFLTGAEFERVHALAKTFTPSRPNANGGDPVEVDVDDALLMYGELSNGALVSCEATRVATGRKNCNQIEINGTKGSIIWNFERMNELEFFSTSDLRAAQGFRRIMCMDEPHPYAAAYWPDGHIIGYEHTFINTLADYLTTLADRSEFRPNFADGWANQRVLDAALTSTETGAWVRIDN
jgi:predicted dehydrogenase